LLLMELDSWQVQGFGYSGIGPAVSVFTNLMNDHMNYYKGDKQQYFDDKANIFKFQSLWHPEKVGQCHLLLKLYLPRPWLLSCWKLLQSHFYRSTEPLSLEWLLL